MRNKGSVIVILAVIFVLSLLVAACGTKTIAPPVLLGDVQSIADVFVGDVVELPKVTATDEKDGDISAKINCAVFFQDGEEIEYQNNSFVPFEAGSYVIKFSVTNSQNKSAQLEYGVTAKPLPADEEDPVITAPDRIEAFMNKPFSLPEITAQDNTDGDVTSSIELTLNDSNGQEIAIPDGDIVLSEAGRYTLTVKATDAAGNSAIKNVYIFVQEWNVSDGVTQNISETTSFSKFYFKGLLTLDSAESHAVKTVKIESDNATVTFFARVDDESDVVRCSELKLTALHGENETVLIDWYTVGGTSAQFTTERDGNNAIAPGTVVTQHNNGWQSFAVPLESYIGNCKDKTIDFKVYQRHDGDDGIGSALYLTNFIIADLGSDADADGDLSTITFDWVEENDNQKSADGLKVFADGKDNYIKPHDTNWYKGVFSDMVGDAADHHVNAYFAKAMTMPNAQDIKMKLHYGAGGDAGVMFKITALTKSGKLLNLNDWTYFYSKEDSVYELLLDEAVAAQIRGENVSVMFQFRDTAVQGGVGEQLYLHKIEFVEHINLGVWTGSGEEVIVETEKQVKFSRYTYNGLLTLGGEQSYAQKSMHVTANNAWVSMFARPRAATQETVFESEIKITASIENQMKILIDWARVGGNSVQISPLNNQPTVEQDNNGYTAFAVSLATYFPDYINKDIEFTVYQRHSGAKGSELYMTGFEVNDLGADADADGNKSTITFDSVDGVGTDGLMINAPGGDNFMRIHDPEGGWYQGRFDDDGAMTDTATNVWFAKQMSMPDSNMMKMRMFFGGDSGILYRVTATDEAGNFIELLDWTYHFSPGGDHWYEEDILNASGVMGKNVTVLFQFRSTNVQNGTSEHRYFNTIEFVENSPAV